MEDDIPFFATPYADAEDRLTLPPPASVRASNEDRLRAALLRHGVWSDTPAYEDQESRFPGTVRVSSVEVHQLVMSDPNERSLYASHILSDMKKGSHVFMRNPQVRFSETVGSNVVYYELSVRKFLRIPDNITFTEKENDAALQTSSESGEC